MRQEYQGNVGFEPGQIGTRPPLLTKLDFQYQVYEAWYMEEDYNFFLRHSLSFMLTFWWLCTFIVSLTFLALALTFIPGYFELGALRDGAHPVHAGVPVLLVLCFLFKVTVVWLMRHR